MEGIDMRVEVIEGVPIRISVVMPVKSVSLYSTIVWRELAVRVRVYTYTLEKIFGTSGKKFSVPFWAWRTLGQFESQDISIRSRWRLMS